jgi:hypothetical protein
MRQRAGLLARLERLERERQRPNLPRIVLCLRDTEDGHIVGYASGKITCLRGDNETASACRDRAFELTGAVMLTALYSEDGHSMAAEREREALPTLTSRERQQDSDPLENVLSDPWPAELAGIGRTASSAELERMGAIPVPPSG